MWPCAALIFATMVCACSPEIAVPGPARSDGGLEIEPSAAADAAVCEQVRYVATSSELPLDIVIMVDSTGSMGDAIEKIRAATTASLVAILEEEGVDYGVISLGADVGLSEVVPDPERFRFLPMTIGSGDRLAFKPVLDAYEDWGGALRQQSVVVFLHFTDSNDRGAGMAIDGYRGSFDEELARIDPDRFADRSNVVYHAFVGIGENAPADAPWLPGQPIVETACSSPAFSDTMQPNPGVGFQELARKTGGLRFPVCQFGRFDVMFRRVAMDAIRWTKIACSLEIPEPPPGKSPLATSLAVRVSTASGEQVLERVESADQCTPYKYTATETRIDLCPDACDVVHSDLSAVVEIGYACTREVL